jgi:predicted ATPase/class 3 adenylate cyclase
VSELPSGTVTFLFTDLEGSTRLWQEHPDAMRPALARHDTIVRDAIEAHGGHFVKTTGDGAHAAFATASDAIDAAIAAQVALASETWALPDPLRVRIGIHSGPAELRDGDYYGTTVNRAARIMSVAYGGQVVASLATQELARDAGVEVVDLGEHRLKDLGQPERIFQVVHPELEREFPPLRSLDTFTTNLPLQRTSFLGRDAELAAVAAALAGSRLVTLTGVGGVGKTRLAVQVAADSVAEFPDGVWLVELAPVGDPDAVSDTVATAVGLVPQPGLSMTASIAEALTGRRSLLVLDNCEHVVDAVADLVEEILARPGPVKILATSREGLRVAEEHLWPVPSLGGRDGGGDDAVLLFVERARAATPDFALAAPGDVEVVGEICRRLDGIPLAIELAAARTISMSTPELRDRLDDRFRLLAGSRRGLERHQTLRHAVQWSYDLLDDDERVLLARCSVFVGGFDLPAAVAVAGGDALDEYAVLDLLDALVRKSLLGADRSSGHTRYSMLETIRQFAQEQLAATADLAEIRVRHTRYFAGEAAVVLRWWDGPRQNEAYEWLARELANLRDAFQAAIDVDDVDSAATIAISAGTLGFYAEIYEPIDWAETLVEPVRTRDHPLLLSLLEVGCLAGYLGRADEALAYLDDVLAIVDDPRYVGLPFGIAAAVAANALMSSDRVEGWLDFCRAEVARMTDRPLYAQTCLICAAVFAGRGGELGSLPAEVVAAAESADNATTLSGALYAYALTALDRDPAAAIAALDRAMVTAREHGSRTLETISGLLLADLEVAHGDPRRALDLSEQILLSLYAAGNRATLGHSLATVAAVLHGVGLDDPAAVHLGALHPGAVVGSPEAERVFRETRERLGDETFAALGRQGAAMDAPTLVAYAREQIEQGRRALATQS